MIELARSDHARVRPMLRPLADNLVVASILDGHTRGRVWVDDVVQPRTACVWNTADALLLGGDPSSHGYRDTFCRLLDDTLRPEAEARGVPFLTLFAEGADWHAALPQACGRQLETVGRRAFQWRGSDLRVEDALPDGMRLRAIDAALLRKADLVNLAAVRGWVDTFWPSHAAFERLGLGYAVVDRETITSWCLTVYAAEDQCELGLETAESHRNQGLATAAALACLEQCRERGLTPHWQSDVDNRPSEAVARKIGFVPVRDTTAYRLWFERS